MLHLRLGPVLSAEHPIHRAPAPAPKSVAPTGPNASVEAAGPCLLLELLPNHLLLHILGLLDVFSRCVLSQTCRTLLQLCGEVRGAGVRAGLLVDCGTAHLPAA